MENLINSLVSLVNDQEGYNTLVPDVIKKIDDAVVVDSLYNLPIKCLVDLIKKASPVKINTAKILMSKAYQAYKSDAILLFTALDVDPKCEFSDLCALIGTIMSAPILQKIANGPQNAYVESLKADSERIFTKLIEIDRQKALEVADKDYTPAEILRAASTGDLKTIVGGITKSKDLLKATDENGMTPLMLAAWNGNFDCTRFLLNEGSVVDEKSGLGSTALMLAAERGHTETISLLVDKGADINIQNNAGSTAISFASLNGHLDAVKRLVELGAKLNIPDQNGTTPLFCAVFGDSVPVAEYLIDNGANLMAVNVRNMTPKQYAKTLQMIEFFKKFDF